MKPTPLKTIIGSIIGLSLLACQKSPAPSSNSNGANGTGYTYNSTFSAAINGNIVYFSGSATYNANTLTINGTSTSGYTIQIVDVAPAAGGTVTLADNASFNSCAKVTQLSNSEIWATDGAHTGTLTISTYNTVNKIVNGTFSFTANETTPTARATTINVSNGSFTNITW